MESQWHFNLHFPGKSEHLFQISHFKSFVKCHINLLPSLFYFIIIII